jgi:NAD(P)-dependent dehydrogenase (short-subunit alcohol dehydrogenase family)
MFLSRYTQKTKGWILDRGKPEEVAWAVLVLASDEAGFIAGQTLVIYGGQIQPESREASL